MLLLLLSNDWLKWLSSCARGVRMCLSCIYWLAISIVAKTRARCESKKCTTISGLSMYAIMKQLKRNWSNSSMIPRLCCKLIDQKSLKLAIFNNKFVKCTRYVDLKPTIPSNLKHRLHEISNFKSRLLELFRNHVLTTITFYASNKMRPRKHTKKRKREKNCALKQMSLF